MVLGRGKVAIVLAMKADMESGGIAPLTLDVATTCVCLSLETNSVLFPNTVLTEWPLLLRCTLVYRQGRNEFLNIICPFESPVVTEGTTGVHLSKIIRSSHTAYSCVLCGSQPARVIFLYSINQSVFTTDTEKVFCAVRAESSNKNRGQSIKV